MGLLLLILMSLVGATATFAQPEWQPAIRFKTWLGAATYLPKLGEAGYVQFWKGPDGVGYGIYDLKTLSDTSTVRAELPGDPYSLRGIYYVRDIDNNGITDIISGSGLFLNVCLPNQRRVVLNAGAGLHSGYADITGDRIDEQYGAQGNAGVLTVFTSDVTTYHTVNIGYPAFHLGTLGGKPRFLSLSIPEYPPNLQQLSLQKVDPAQLTPEATTAKLITLDSVLFKISFNNPWNPKRLVVFPNVWYLSRYDSMWVITADTIVAVRADSSFGIGETHHGQNYRDPLVINGTRPELIHSGFVHNGEEIVVRCEDSDKRELRFNRERDGKFSGIAEVLRILSGPTIDLVSEAIEVGNDVDLIVDNIGTLRNGVELRCEDVDVYGKHIGDTRVRLTMPTATISDDLEEKQTPQRTTYRLTNGGSKLYRLRLSVPDGSIMNEVIVLDAEAESKGKQTRVSSMHVIDLASGSVRSQHDAAKPLAYPNPASTEIRVVPSARSSGTSHLVVELIDGLGRSAKVWRGEYVSVVVLPIEDVPAGIYSIRTTWASGEQGSVMVAIQR
ncbi:MAG: hypothetical protein SGJ05_05500 [bacterium]|nr:hypothetical protein [bacterium]